MRLTRKKLVAATAAAALIGGGIALTTASASTPSSTAATHVLTVAQDGTGQYSTVQAAINAVPTGSTPYVIRIGKGTYHEVVNVPSTKTYLTLEGATGNADDVVITYGSAQWMKKSDGSTYGTAGSATATFAGAYFTAQYLTFANSYDPDSYPTQTQNQAVAVDASADHMVFDHDRFLGHQDTLLAWAATPTTQARQYYRYSYIAGDVDFMFGDATAVFDHDNINALVRKTNAGGFLTAAATSSSRQYGFLIDNSTVSSANTTGLFHLGRPWIAYSGASPQVVVRNTALPAGISAAAPWVDMTSSYSWKSARFDSYANTGAGAGSNSNTPTLTAAQAASYTPQGYLAGTDGWDPTTVSSSALAAAAGVSAGSTASSSASAAASVSAGASVKASASVSGSAAAVSLSGITGDTRTVTQPVVPGVCQTLKATLTASNRAFSAAVEASAPDTSRVQAALTACAGTGKAVELATSGSYNAFLTGPLKLGSGVTLLIDSGTTLYGSRKASDYQVSGKPTCGTVSSSEGGCAPLLSVTGANSAIEGVRAASGSQGTIDGRGDQTLIGQSTTWWGLATTAKNNGGNQNDPRMVQAAKANNFTLYDINLINSPNFNVSYQNGNGFTAWGVRIKTPANARNTDGIDPAGATNVTINESYIQDGDDGIAIKGASASSNITVENSHFYGTHGMSIGSETNSGVTNVLFVNNTVSGSDSSGIVSSSDNGIRIKSDSSRGGKVSKIGYVNTCLTGVKSLLVFDPYYSSSTGSLIPNFTGIVVDGLKSVNSVSKASSTLSGYNSSYPLGLTLEHVSLDATSSTAKYASVSTYDSNVSVSGTGVSVTALGSATGSVPSCSFPTFPAL